MVPLLLLRLRSGNNRRRAKDGARPLPRSRQPRKQPKGVAAINRPLDSVRKQFPCAPPAKFVSSRSLRGRFQMKVIMQPVVIPIDRAAIGTATGWAALIVADERILDAKHRV